MRAEHGNEPIRPSQDQDATQFQFGRLRVFALTTIAVVVVGAAMHAAAIAVVPIVSALLLCLLFWPMRSFLCRWIPAWISAGACCLIAVLVLLVIGWWGWYAGTQALEVFSSSQDKYVGRLDEMAGRLEHMGVPKSMLPAFGGVEQGSEGAEGAPERAGEASPSNGGASMQNGRELRRRVVSFVAGGMRSAAGIGGALTLTIFLLYLALFEGERWSARARSGLSTDAYIALHNFAKGTARHARRYVLAKTITGVVSGVATGLWLWAMDVPMPVVWGMLTFLLNYIPNIGALLSSVPPILLSVIELGWGSALIIASGLVVIEILVGNLLDPLLQGNTMKLSPFVALASLLVWGWIWGVVGAVMAPLLTAAILTGVHELRQLPVNWFRTALLNYG